jgi:hypothetical protein
MNLTPNSAPRRFRGSIDLGDPQAVVYWSGKLSITPNQLRRAIKQVGTDVAELAKYLGKPGAIRADQGPVIVFVSGWQKVRC